MIRQHHQQAFERDGFAIVKGGFSAAEVDILQRVAQGEERVRQANGMLDAEGRTSKISLTREIPDDVWGRISRLPRLVRGVEMLLGEEVYHWHSKIMIKEAHEGGAWEWHQDYGYWYHDDPPFPRMLSAMVAVTSADRDNGCLKVLRGSHLCGRLDHGKVGQQTGADVERVQALMERLEVVYCTLEPGDVLFFHCNVLHASEPNDSERARISYICCYNAIDNPPLTKVGHGECERIELGPDHLEDLV